MWTCPKCGEQHDDDFDACWKCAAPIVVVAEPTAPIIEVPDTCRSCGYSLMGLLEDALCPECATAVSSSRSSTDLLDADPGWQRRLLQGQSYLALGAIAGLLALLAMMLSFVSGVAGRITTNAMLIALAPYSLSVSRAIGLVALMACALGAFLVTSQDPRDALRERVSAPRVVFRVALAVACFALGLEIFSRTLLPSLSNPVWTLSFPVLLGVSLYLALSTGLRWFARLADRMQSQRLREGAEQRAHTFRWALPGLMVGEVVEHVAPLLNLPSGNVFADALRRFGPMVWVVCFIALLIAFIKLCSLMIAFHRELRMCLASGNPNPSGHTRSNSNI